MLSTGTAFILLFLVGILGISLGYLLRFLQMAVAKAQLEVNVKKTILKAREKAADIIARANAQTEDLRLDLEKRTKQVKQLKQDLETTQTELDASISRIKHKESKLDESVTYYQKKLSELAAGKNISTTDIKQEISTSIDNQLHSYYQKKLSYYKANAEDEISRLLTGIMPDIARRTVRNNTSVTVNVSGDEIGKVIGKDGINIKAFERYAGVDLVIDDTANTVTISTFDPKRRLIAKQALIELLEDGRINRERIYEQIQRVEDRYRSEANKLLNRGLKDLDLDTNQYLVIPEITHLLAELYFRHSYGQNQLEHSLEVADIAGRMAAELSPDLITAAKLAGLFHDLGKTFGDQNDHVADGVTTLEQHNFPPEVIAAIGEHHEASATTLLSAILQAADAVSSGRPGARIQSTTNYQIRLENLEEVVSEFEDVDNVYALSGGRELQILIKNKDYSKANMQALLANIVARLEEEKVLTGPTTIHMIREDEIIKNVA